MASCRVRVCVMREKVTYHRHVCTERERERVEKETEGTYVSGLRYSIMIRVDHD
jgi:hypothetical protein